MEWESLLIIRPAEIWGGGSNEGIDRMLAVASKWRIVPALFGSNLLFAPIHIEDFTRLAAESIQQHRKGVRIENMCGPEDLNGMALSYRIAKRYHAVRLPLWWPAVAVCLKALHKIGIGIVKPDQLTRLVCEKTGGAKNNDSTLRRFS